MARSDRWKVVAICALSQNCATGLTFGSYGAALVALQKHLGVSRTDISLGPGIILLAFCLSSPFVGNLLNTVPARKLMILGAVINCVGYLMLAHVDQLWQFLLILGVMIGPATCLLGALPASTVVSRWFERDRGKALAVANVPAFMLLVPPIAAWVVVHGGVRDLFLAISVTFIMLIPLLMLLVERPRDEDPGLRNHAQVANSVRVGSTHDPLRSALNILSNPCFWLLNCGIGLVLGAASSFTTHIVPIAMDKGLSLTSASLLISVYGAGTILGVPVFGWLIDRLGPMITLIANAILQTLLWTSIDLGDDMASLAVAAGLIGACIGAIVAIHGAVLNDIFGQANFSRSMGYSYAVKMPFLSAMVPLVGYLYDVSGNYGSALAMICGFLLASTMLFSATSLIHRNSLRRANARVTS